MSLDANIAASEDLLGKVVADLQTGISIGSTGVVSGTLNYVTGYTGFSGDPTLQEGNYLAVHASGVPEGVTITAQLSGSEKVTTLTDDRILIVRVTATTQNLTINAIADGAVVSKVYPLSGLTLTPEGE